jgi:hypothetical protein
MTEQRPNQTGPDFAALLASATTDPGIVSAAYSAFHNYSFLNQLRAYEQCQTREIPIGPIASFHGWKDHGRHVSKGSKAIELCMPVTCKGDIDDETGKPRTYTKFVFRRNWFVLAQTEGADYIAPPPPAWDKAQALAALDVAEVPFEMIDGNCHGYAFARSVAVSAVAEFPYKTLFHEIAHVILGHTSEGQMNDGAQTPRNIKELEAEATAMLVGAALGLPGLEESRGYIQHWYGAGREVPQDSARRIFKATDQILKAGAPAQKGGE